MKSYDEEILYKSFFDNAFHGLAYCEMIFDALNHPIDFKCVRVNRQLETLMGFGSIEGRNITELIPGIQVSNPELFEIAGGIARDGETKHFEIYIEPLSTWFSIGAYCPKSNFFLAALQDITERKKIEKKLENAKIAARNVLEDLQAEKELLAYVSAKNDAILSCVTDGIIEVDSDGNIIFINQAAQNLIGWSHTEIMGRPLSNHIFIEDRGGRRAVLFGKPQSITRVASSYYCIRKDATELAVSIEASPMIFQGRCIGEVVVFRDISWEKEIDKVKTEFVSLASHQLLTPVTSIKWYTEIMMKEMDLSSELQREYVVSIHESNQRLTDIIYALLDVSRLELGVFMMESNPTNIKDIVGCFFDEQKELAQRKGISMTTIFSTAFPLAYIDQKFLHMVVINILSNAIKYTPFGGKIECSVRGVSVGEILDNHHVSEESFLIQITDTGCGIPSNQHSAIFSKLFRADNVRAKDVDGTGLGLYIAKTIINHSGGRIWFQSEENKGSTFFIMLPLSNIRQKT